MSATVVAIEGFQNEVCQDLIIVRSILNFVTAERAWGSLAGMIVISPFFSLTCLPDMVMSASPSSM